MRTLLLVSGGIVALAATVKYFTSKSTASAAPPNNTPNAGNGSLVGSVDWVPTPRTSGLLPNVPAPSAVAIAALKVGDKVTFTMAAPSALAEANGGSVPQIVVFAQIDAITDSTDLATGSPSKDYAVRLLDVTSSSTKSSPPANTLPQPVTDKNAGRGGVVHISADVIASVSPT